MIKGRRLRLEGDLPTYCEDVYLERWSYDDAGEYVISDHFSSGDYVGSLAEASNRRVFLEELAQFCGTEFWPTYSGHSYTGIVFRRDADERVPQIGEMFGALESSSILDEEDWSNLESEQESDDWDSYGRGDFRRWLSDEGQAYLPEMTRTLVMYQYAHGGSTNVYRVLRELPVDVVVEIAEHVTGVEDEELSGFDPDSNSFTDWASNEHDRTIDKLWYDLMAVGGGSGEVEHEQGGTHFNFKRLFRIQKPDLDEELNERSWNALRQILLVEELRWPSGASMQVFLDYLLEQGGEWSPVATRILQSELR